jgi:hypothetical protein
VVRKTGPVSLLDGVERAAQREGIDVFFERGRSELSSSQRQAGGESKKTRHGDFDLYEYISKEREESVRFVQQKNVYSWFSKDRTKARKECR